MLGGRIIIILGLWIVRDRSFFVSITMSVVASCLRLAPRVAVHQLLHEKVVVEFSQHNDLLGVYGGKIIGLVTTTSRRCVWPRHICTEFRRQSESVVGVKSSFILLLFVAVQPSEVSVV